MPISWDSKTVAAFLRLTDILRLLCHFTLASVNIFVDNNIKGLVINNRGKIGLFILTKRHYLIYFK